jgi:phosphoribosylpyrophosphate synthetase
MYSVEIGESVRGEDVYIVQEPILRISISSEKKWRTLCLKIWDKKLSKNNVLICLTITPNSFAFTGINKAQNR